MVANLGEVEAALRRYQGDALLIAAPAGFDDALVLATTPACADVIAGFEQALSQLTDPERDQIRAAWLPDRPRNWPSSSPLRWLVPASLILLALALVHAYGYWRVHRESVRRRVVEQRLQEVTANLPAVVYQARRSACGHYSFRRSPATCSPCSESAWRARASITSGCWLRSTPRTAQGDGLYRDSRIGAWPDRCHFPYPFTTGLAMGAFAWATVVLRR